MTLNKFFFYLTTLTLSLFILASCGDDEKMKEDETPSCTEANASGNIDGKPFNFQAGNAFDNSDGSVDIRLYSDEMVISDICTFNPSFGDNSVNIFGDLPSATIGRIELFLEPDWSDGYTLTLFDEEDFNNIIATEGFIEITEVTDETISGILDVDAGGGDSVCGSFTLTRCQ